MSAKKFKFIPKRCKLCKYYSISIQVIYNQKVKNAACLNQRFGHGDANPEEYCSEFTPNVSTVKTT